MAIVAFDAASRREPYILRLTKQAAQEVSRALPPAAANRTKGTRFEPQAVSSAGQLDRLCYPQCFRANKGIRASTGTATVRLRELTYAPARGLAVRFINIAATIAARGHGFLDGGAL